ncbi:MAG: hypothetical protein DRQ78_01215 [Epsilonproteobacteria bacterium]|nr:MAG: hypothetical protein DRQ78_01215 [Campylobacterota bacterium]
MKSVVKTSQVNPLEIENGFKRGLESAEHVFYVPISTGLSSTYSTASAIAAKPEFKGKVTIYDSHYITP